MVKKKKRGRKIVIWTVLLFIAASVVAYGLLTRSTLSNYNKVTAKKGDITTYYSFSGTVAAVDSEIVYASTAMQIDEIKVTEGQLVEKDDVLMVTTMGVKIKAPIDGTVTDIAPSVNAQLVPGAKLCKVTDYTNLELGIQVDEFDLSAVSADKTAIVTVNALKMDIIGTVSSVAKDGVYSNGVTYFNVKIKLTDYADLRVGMTAQAKILNRSAYSVTLLPMSAIQFDSDNNPFVYISDGKRSVTKLQLTLGINDGTNVEVLSGIADGDTVYVPRTNASIGFANMGGTGTQRTSSSTNQTSPGFTSANASGGSAK